MSEWREIIVENLILAADIGLTVLFYRWYKDRCSTAEQLKGLESLKWPLYEADPAIVANGSIEYGLVEGAVYPVGDSLKSQYTSDEGPIRYFKRVLHKSERNRGYWTDRNTVLSESYDKVPFALFGGDRMRGVLVTEPRSADYLQEALHTTYDEFEPYAGRSFGGEILDRVVGEITKGYQTTEQILKSGTAMLGVGKITLSNGSLQLEKPTVKGSQYILTSMSKSELISHLKSRATVFKAIAGVFGITGLVILLVTTGSRIRQWVEDYRARSALQAVHQQLAEMRENNTGSSAADNRNTDASPLRTPDENNQCVVCLTSARNIANRPCGHVCTCISCYEAMPSPKLCPVCRSPVREIIPIYIP